MYLHREFGTELEEMKNPGCMQASDVFVPKAHLHYPWVL